MRARPGLTLLDLAILAALGLGFLAVCLPSFQGSMGKARNASVAANINDIRMALERYSADHAGDLPPVAGPQGLVPALTGKVAYLRAGRWPRAPWGQGEQRVAVAATTVRTVEPAGALAGAGRAPSAMGTRLGLSLRAAVPFGGGPDDGRVLGAISYDRQGRHYTLYGTGERSVPGIFGADTTGAMVVSICTNLDAP